MAYYTYVYRDPSKNNEPFYVGTCQGSGKTQPGRYVLPSEVRHRVDEIKANGLTPLFESFLAVCAEDAYSIKASLIGQFGQVRLNTGTLLNSNRPSLILNAFVKGHKESDETKAKKSESAKGRVFSDEAKANMSEAAKKRVTTQGNSNLFKPGRVVSAEERAKLSALHKGKKVSDETRAKMSAASKGKPKSDVHRAKMVAAWRRKRFQKQIDEMEIIF